MKTVEEPLNILGNILIALGWIAGILSMIMSFIESERFFYFILSCSCILSGYLSGYLFKGISNIISLLSSSNLESNKSDSRSWEEIGQSMKKE